MTLMKDGLWEIVNKTETDPGCEALKANKKFVSRKNCALAIIVLSLEPSLLYLISDVANVRQGNMHTD